MFFFFEKAASIRRKSTKSVSWSAPWKQLKSEAKWRVLKTSFARTEEESGVKYSPINQFVKGFRDPSFTTSRGDIWKLYPPSAIPICKMHPPSKPFQTKSLLSSSGIDFISCKGRTIIVLEVGGWGGGGMGKFLKNCLQGLKRKKNSSPGRFSLQSQGETSCGRGCFFFSDPANNFFQYKDNINCLQTW